jgi:alanyl-tRNA synthetase
MPGGYGADPGRRDGVAHRLRFLALDLCRQRVSCRTSEVMALPEAQAKGAIGLFTDKYGGQVLVYKIGKRSMELCGGPHVGNTEEIGRFKIEKEQSSSAGVRRIRAVIQ